MKKIVFFSFIVLVSLLGNAQPPMNCYRIYLHDKADSPYSIQRPQDFLSDRAIAKRERFNIAITEEDFPVNPAYLQAIRAADDSVLVLATSRWFNTVVVRCPNAAALTTIGELAFVDSILPVGLLTDLSEQSDTPVIDVVGEVYEPRTDTLQYGKGLPQIAVHNGHLLHNEGFRGDGMLITMLDGGWLSFDRNPYFANLYENGQIWGTYNFVPGRDDVYWKNTHGTACASIILSNINTGTQSGPVQFVGTAPNANMIFIRTEYEDNEQLMEEDFWVAGAEIADSVGSDVLTASLGYTYFDVPETASDINTLDGQSSLASRAATIAAHKGIVVCIAAGNEGSHDWHRISRPADAEDVLAVGAVGIDSLPASFTGVGPSFDGRVKPDVASVGFQTEVVLAQLNTTIDSITFEQFHSIYSLIYPGNGTSFATPCLAGLAACLWQALPQYNSLEIMQIIREAGHIYNSPDTLMGYGIPDFYRAYLENRDTTISISENQLLNDINVYPNPCHNQFNIHNLTKASKDITVFDMSGKIILTKTIPQESNEVISTENWSNGLYLLLSKSGKGWTEAIKIIRQ